jgi:hypothetical protein
LLGDLSARMAELASSNPAKDLEKNFRGMLSKPSRASISPARIRRAGQCSRARGRNCPRSGARRGTDGAGKSRVR